MKALKPLAGFRHHDLLNCPLRARRAVPPANSPPKRRLQRLSTRFLHDCSRCAFAGDPTPPSSGEWRRPTLPCRRCYARSSVEAAPRDSPQKNERVIIFCQSLPLGARCCAGLACGARRCSQSSARCHATICSSKRRRDVKLFNCYSELDLRARKLGGTSLFRHLGKSKAAAASDYSSAPTKHRTPVIGRTRVPSCRYQLHQELPAVEASGSVPAGIDSVLAELRWQPTTGAVRRP